MLLIKIVLLLVASLAILLLACIFLTLCITPMPLVKRMRRGESSPTANLTYPPQYAAAKAAVERISDLEYPSAYHNNAYDLYYPKEYSGKLPTIIWIHGGAFIAGSRYGIENVAVMLAHAGYAVVAAEYAQAPEAKHPAAVLQMGELYAHLCQKAHVQLDLETIFIAGDSAGAQIASEFVAAQTNKALADAIGMHTGIPQNALRGAILTCGPYDLAAIRNADSRLLRFGLWLLGRALFDGRPWHKSDACRQSTTALQVTAAYPPTYITDGNTGSFEMQGRRLAQALRDKNVAVVERYFDIADGEVGHEYLFQLADEKAQLCLADIIAFIKEQAGRGSE